LLLGVGPTGSRIRQRQRDESEVSGRTQKQK
jgi:hypothetical protein